MARLNHIQNLRQIFQKAVESVRPHQLLSEFNGFHLNPDHGSILLRDKKFEITDKHVVGFGNAVLDMATLSKGCIDQLRNVPEMSLKEKSVIQVIGCGEHNQPDDTFAEVALINNKIMPK